MRALIAASVLALFVGTADAQRPMQTGRGGNLGTLVVANADLQKELKITDDQKTKFKEVAEKQTEQAKKLRELFTGGGARPDRAKMTEIQAEMTKVRDEVKKVTEDVLTSDQKKRIKQLEIQMMGLRAFTNEEVVKELNISDEQKTKIKEVSDEVNKDLRAAGGGFQRPMPGQQPDLEKLAESRKKRTEITDKAMEKISATLSDDQKKSWTELTGPKVDTSKFNLLSGLGGRGQNN